MKKLALIACATLSLAACESVRDNHITTYANNPQKVTVNVDEAKIYVVQDGYSEYVAWGGPALKEKSYPTYRRMRAIEVVSKCRINKVLSKQPGEVLRASVKC